MKATAIVVFALFSSGTLAAREDGARKQAVIAALSGDASVESAARRSPARLREWVLSGDTLVVGDGGRVVVGFRSGRRFELRGPTRATVTGDAMRPASGVSELERLPSWPRDIEPGEVRGGRAAGTRVRSGTIEGLIPAEGDLVAPNDVSLRFGPEARAKGYAVEVRNERGKLVFEASVSGPPVRLPGGTLGPGHEYVWAVEAVGTEASGEAAFRTLDARTNDARQRILQHGDDPDTRTYLEALDEALGLAKRP